MIARADSDIQHPPFKDRTTEPCPPGNHAMTPQARRRATVVCLAVVGVYSWFSARLVELQIDQGAHFAALASQKQVFRQVIPAHRGSIRDIHNEALADDLPMRRVVADATRLRVLPPPKDPADKTKGKDAAQDKPDAALEAASLLADTLELDEAALKEKLATKRPYLILARQVSVDKATLLKTRLEAHRLAGIYFEQDASRIYPNGSLLCHAIGFTNYDGAGIEGVEKSMDRYLQGRPGYRYITRDRTGAELVQHRGIEQPPHDGCDVRLTIDMGLQNIVERELDAAMKIYNPDTAVVIFTRPKTGEILAMASRPNFDLNARADAALEDKVNRAVLSMVEPGSTFKIVTVSAALNEKLVAAGTQINCEGGRWMYNGNLLHDAHPLGTLTVHDILVHSSNIGAAKLGLQLGENRLYDYVKTLGFGDRTGIDLPGEIGGVIHPVKNWSKISITHIPMGHEVGVTPMQLVMAMGAMANGGKLMAPQIIHSITDDRGAVIAEYKPAVVRQAIRPEVAREVVEALKDVVSAKGTAKGAAVEGQVVAGKTGTAQKVGDHGTYLPGKYVVSFCGFFPADDPEILGLVMLDNATTRAGENYGGKVSGPIFASIAEKAARYFNLEPTAPILVANPPKGGGGARPDDD